MSSLPVADRFLPEFPRFPGEAYDIVLVTGDAYVDHPSFGAALIGRYLESLGYTVGILAQPEWKDAEEFRRFGRPRLFFGVTAGNLDSMVAHYTPDRRRRDADAYTPGGAPGRRPDLAALVYAQRCREAYPDVPVVLGGIEASLRRFSHVDFVQQKIRGPILMDAKADYLVYGMGERAVAALAKGFAEGASAEALQAVPGICWISPERPEGEGVVELPDAQAAAEDRETFFDLSRKLLRALDDPRVPTIAQPSAGRWVVANPPAEPLSGAELDALYQLPFARATPERHEEAGGVPALAPVKFSITTHRGCYGGCSFCAITAHQGKAVTSRPADGVLREAKRLAARDDFTGTFPDVGGPTANMYGTRCAKAPEGKSGCARPSCLHPEVCKHLETSGVPFLELLRGVRRVPGVKHAFVASGLRHDMLVLPTQRRLLRELLKHHTGGQMKIAPEHVANRPLRLMRKPGMGAYKEFRALFNTLRDECESKLYPVPYLIAGHPGTTLEDAVDLARFAKRLGHFAEQVQQFTPTPMTPATCMYWTRRDPDTGESVFVPTGAEAKLQKALAQFQAPRNREKITRFFARRGDRAILDELYAPKQERGGGKGGRKPFATGADRAIIRNPGKRTHRR